MYIIECKTKLGATRYVRHAHIGDKILYSPRRADAHKFASLATAQNYRDDALEDNQRVLILRG
jgi:hypothetical protein